MMSRRIYISVLAVCVLLGGCTDDSYRGLYDFYHSGYHTSEIPVWIKIGESTDIEAKGNGVVEDTKGFGDRDFYVYAFNKDKGTSYAKLSSDDALNTLLDGSIDDANSLAGRTAEWNRKYERVVWKDGKDVYWPVSEVKDYRYDFFAYYIDDMEVRKEDYTRTEDRITLNVEIDGRQDIMSAKAAPSRLKLETMFPDEKERVYYEHYYCYSWQSAIMNLQPEFVFNHHMTKIRFQAKPGVKKDVVNEVTIMGLAIESRYKGTFTVAARDGELGIDFTDKPKEFPMPGVDRDHSYVVTTLREAPSDGTYPLTDIGDYLLLAPSANGYNIHLTMSERRDTDLDGVFDEDRGEGSYSTFIYQGTKEQPDPFEPGSEYTVTLNVYGREDVRVNVEVTPWEGGGYGVPDTEDRPPEADE